MLLSAVSSTIVSFKNFITTSGVSIYLSFHLSFGMKFKVQCFLQAFSKQSIQLAIICRLSFHFLTVCSLPSYSDITLIPHRCLLLQFLHFDSKLINSFSHFAMF